MEKIDVLVIGGSAAGLTAAMTAKANAPEKRVMVIRKEEQVMIPCGIPYIFGSLNSSNENILPDQGLINLGVEIKIGVVDEISRDQNQITTVAGDTIGFDKLIIATGSLPFIPGWLKGSDLNNVFTVPKNKAYLDKLSTSLDSCRNIVVIGAGFIGVEISDEINKKDKNVTLVEIMPHILGAAFDEDIAMDAQEELAKRNVNIITGIGVEEIIGTDKVAKVKLANGQTLDADAVVLAMGYCPNTQLAQNINLRLNELGFIQVDQYMRTSRKDIFAVGDCAAKKDFATGKPSSIMLASTACAEARVAGLNLFHLSTYQSFGGTIGIYSTSIGESAYGVAGLIERTALNEGFSVITGSFAGIDRHPGKLNNAHKQMVKLIVSKDSLKILGGEVIGGVSAGELTNVLGFIIQGGLTLMDLLVSQIGTQPMLTASPAAYPIIKAAQNALLKLRNDK